METFLDPKLHPGSMNGKQKRTARSGYRTVYGFTAQQRKTVSMQFSGQILHKNMGNLGSLMP